MTNKQDQKRVRDAASAFIEAAEQNPRLAYASEHCGMALYEFINYVETIDPELTREEATRLAAGILLGLPSLLTGSPVIIESIREQARKLKAERE
jgi:hypothetical protein